MSGSARVGAGSKPAPLPHVAAAPGTRPSEAAPTLQELAASQMSKRLGWGVFLICLAVYLFTANGHMLGQDQEYYYRMAKSLVLEGSFAVEPLGIGEHEAGGRGADGRFYAGYPPGLPAALAPLVAIGHGQIGPAAELRPQYVWGHADVRDLGARFVVSYFNVPVTAATAALLALLVLKLGYRPEAALAVAIAFAFATHAWGNARVVFPDPLLGMLILLACVLILGSPPERAWRGGLALAAALLVKVTAMLALPALLLLPDASGRPLWRSRRALAVVLGPTLVALALNAIYNNARYGNPLSTGFAASGSGQSFFGDPLDGLVGLTVASGHGVIWFAPAILVAAVGFRRFYREHTQPALAVVALALPWLAFHASFSGWSGGWAWGPRYLLPVLPLVLIPLAAAWPDRRARLGAFVLIALGILVAIPGALTDFMATNREAPRYLAEICPGCGPPIGWLPRFDPTKSEIALHSWMVWSGKLDLAWVTFSGTWVVPMTFGLVLGLGLAGLALIRRSFAVALPAAGKLRSVAARVAGSQGAHHKQVAARSPGKRR